MDVLLPQTAVDMLPFSAEPLSQWNRKTDIHRFITALYADIYPPFSSYLYKEGKRQIKTCARQFVVNAERAQKDLGGYDVHAFMVESIDPHPEIEEKDRFSAAEDTQSVSPTTEKKVIPSIVDDLEFGKAAKYVIAWRCCVQTLLEEGGFYSLAHILETETEIESSLLLASHIYYKQAVQVLRSFLEELIMPIHFCENAHEFNQWKENNYRTPPLRGRDGLIRRLTARGILPATIAQEAADLYGDLNSYIHGSENRLNYKNVHSSSASGRAFNYKDFSKWTGYLSRSVDLGIRLLRVNYLQWDAILSPKMESLRREGKIFCTSCHNETDFDIMPLTTEMVEFEIPQADGSWVKADESFPGFIMYTCRQCGSLIAMRAEK